jgi:outer membrane protein assembly factor BamE (lipoprotein component of BamABCDE complex)
MKRCFTITGIIVFFVCTIGCASSGQKIDTKKLSKIDDGVQSKEQITTLFGEPSYKRLNNNDYYATQVLIPVTMAFPSESTPITSDTNNPVKDCCERWAYEYEAKKDSKDAGHSEVLVVNFDRDGMVRGYTFESKDAITRDQVKELKELTGAPTMQCKNVLSEMHGDIDKSADELHKRGFVTATMR